MAYTHYSIYAVACKKHRGKLANWEVRWTGPFVIENKLNSANYVVKKGRGKPVVIHIDRLRKLPTEMGTDDIGRPANDGSATSPPAKHRKPDIPAAATDTASVETANCAEPEFSRLVTRAASRRGQRRTTHSPRTGLGFSAHIPSPPQSRDATVAQSAACSDRPRPPWAHRPTRACRRPAHYVQQVQAVLTNQACARRTTCRTGTSSAAVAICFPASDNSARAPCRRSLVEDRPGSRSSRSVHDDFSMQRSRVMRREADCSDSESDSGSASWWA